MRQDRYTSRGYAFAVIIQQLLLLQGKLVPSTVDARLQRAFLLLIASWQGDDKRMMHYWCWRINAIA